MPQAREPVQLGDQDAAFGGLGCGESCCELRQTIEGIDALTRLGFDALRNEGHSVGFGELRR
jgi:hypothetical protein